MPKAKKKAIKPGLKRKTGLTSEERIARASEAAAARWAKFYAAPPKEQAAMRAAMSANSLGKGRPRDKSQPRCICKVMTLKRARARGFELAHKPTCTFYPR